MLGPTRGELVCSLAEQAHELMQAVLGMVQPFALNNYDAFQQSTSSVVRAIPGTHGKRQRADGTVAVNAA